MPQPKCSDLRHRREGLDGDPNEQTCIKQRDRSWIWQWCDPVCNVPLDEGIPVPLLCSGACPRGVSVTREPTTRAWRPSGTALGTAAMRDASSKFWDALFRELERGHNKDSRSEGHIFTLLRDTGIQKGHRSREGDTNRTQRDTKRATF